MDAVIITDTHFAASSNVRVGDYFNELLIKLDYVIEKTNKWGAQLFHCGDFFDKPSVPDFVKLRLMASLKKLERPMIVITGNHDRLYGSDERYERTSLALLEESGLVQVIQPGELLDFDQFVVTTGRPVSYNGDKPLLVLNHGFLNQEDGLSTFYLQDIMTDAQALVVLGHDHVTYPPVKYKNAIVLRPGSFARAIRNESADRIPDMIRAKVKDGAWIYKPYPIEVAAPVQLLFKTSAKKLQKSEITYESLIKLINSSEEEESLEKALRLVTTPDMVNFILNKLN